MSWSPRRRVLVAFFASLPFLLVYMLWVWFNGTNVIRWISNGYVSCEGDAPYFTFFNSCRPDRYSVGWAVFQLLAVTALVLLAAVLVSRWAMQPIKSMAETVGALGPTSLGLRLTADPGNDETRQLTLAINAMLDRVAEGYESQRRFAANASHELRTPLATQRALIEVSLTSALTPDQVELLTRQLLATNRRNELLIEGLLVLAETDRGLMANSPQRLDLIVAATVGNVRATAEQRRIRIVTELVPTTVSGELPLLERLVTNLLQNAIKYNRADGWVHVAVQPPGTLRVGNSGSPVPAEQVAGLFEPFRRGTGDRLDHGAGVGLGLTIVRSIVAAHHGAVEGVANPDGGLTVDVRLPGARPVDDPRRTQPIVRQPLS